jgi:hypothetical protein
MFAQFLRSTVVDVIAHVTDCKPVARLSASARSVLLISLAPLAVRPSVAVAQTPLSLLAELLSALAAEPSTNAR